MEGTSWLLVANIHCFQGRSRQRDQKIIERIFNRRQLNGIKFKVSTSASNVRFEYPSCLLNARHQGCMTGFVIKVTKFHALPALVFYCSLPRPNVNTYYCKSMPTTYNKDNVENILIIYFLYPSSVFHHALA